MRYYRNITNGYAQITAPMEKLLKKDVTFYWNEDYKKILDVLKEKMATVLISVFPDWKKEFHVHVDASCIVLGGYPIEFIRRRLSKAEKNYSTTKHKGLDMVYVLEKFRHYLLGGHFKCIWIVPR